MYMLVPFGMTNKIMPTHLREIQVQKIVHVDDEIISVVVCMWLCVKKRKKAQGNKPASSHAGLPAPSTKSSQFTIYTHTHHHTTIYPPPKRHNQTLSCFAVTRFFHLNSQAKEGQQQQQKLQPTPC